MKKGIYLTVADAVKIIKANPNTTVIRSDGMGFFDPKVARTSGFDTYVMTFRTAEALAKRGYITFRDATAHTGYWIGFVAAE